MNDEQHNDSTPAVKNQVLGQPSGCSKAVKPAIFAILPDGTVLEDAEVEPPPVTELLHDIGNSLRDITESLDAALIIATNWTR